MASVGTDPTIEMEYTAKPTTRSTSKKAAPVEKKRKGDQDSDSIDAEKAPRKKKAPAHKVQTERAEIPKLWDKEKATESGTYTFKIASWNVAGLRAMLKKTPNAMRELVDRHDLDVLCLQETKLQDCHLDDPKLKLRETIQIVNDYDDYWSCSTVKKGYSGTAVFVRKHEGAGKGKKSAKQTTLASFIADAAKDDIKPKARLPIDEKLLVPVTATYGIDKSEHDLEGRTITVNFPRFSLCNVYVPNSGEKLDRLAYRTKEWDRDFLDYMQTLSARNKKPVLWLGDLNVAHTDLEVWNAGAKHLAKQAGVTDAERASFQSQLDSGFIDAFRHLHPNATGHYSYWSTRAGNRPLNKGLRLDYFVCHPDLFKTDAAAVVRDRYMDFHQQGSDHCPVILEISMH